MRVALAGTAGLAFAGGLVVPRAQPGPRRQVCGGGKAGHVDTGLCDDDFGDALADPGHAHQARRLFSERGVANNEASATERWVRRAALGLAIRGGRRRGRPAVLWF